MADGFIYKYEKVDVYHYPSNSLVGEFVETYYDTIESVHFNWGWMGKGNGFYSGNIFRVEKSDTTVALFNETKFLTISAQ